MCNLIVFMSIDIHLEESELMARIIIVL